MRGVFFTPDPFESSKKKLGVLLKIERFLAKTENRIASFFFGLMIQRGAGGPKKRRAF